jgi:hypothetical protein
MTTQSSGTVKSSPVAALLLIVVVTVVGCSRGPSPPQPTETLRPTTVGVVIATASGAPPFGLRGGGRFEVPPGAMVRRLTNWPADPADEPDELGPGMLLLGGQAADGSWWYEVAGFGPTGDGCWPIYGGSFDRGDSVQFSSGLEVPKAPTFEIRSHGHSSVGAFPGHQDDSVCIDDQGRATYFDLFIGG